MAAAGSGPRCGRMDSALEIDHDDAARRLLLVVCLGASTGTILRGRQRQLHRGALALVAGALAALDFFDDEGVQHGFALPQPTYPGVRPPPRPGSSLL